ncbi:MAG: beta-galactosidase [Blautia wexlerae]|nr:beta-galactosidase [Blautia wexlerae]
MALTKWNGILYGGDYCPEQWDEETLHEDIRIMKEYGINAVTLNVHSWCVYQPEEGAYSFGVMDHIIHLLEENGINIVMATGTAALPNWLLKKYPDIMAQSIRGVRNRPARRVNYCPNNKEFKHRIQEICEVLAKHYKDQKNIVLWHLSNELEGHCYCDCCANEYREWLKERYGSLEALNKAWNTMFWGHVYTDWEQINPPAYDNMVMENVNGAGIDLSAFPTESMEYKRFMTESFKKDFEIEKAAILKYISDALVTNNFQFREYDYDELAKPLDIVSFDLYPEKNDSPHKAAFFLDMCRGLKKKQSPFLMMEMSPNQASWAMSCPVKRPNEVSSIAVSSLARGAESAMFFQIRRSRAGFEKFHGAMIEHSGRTDTRQGKELKKLGSNLKKMGDSFLGTEVPAEVAIIADWNYKWGIEVTSFPKKGTKYFDEVLYYYKWFHDQNIMTDVVRADSDLSRYKMVIAPMMYMLTEKQADNIKAYVKNGGCFITTYFSGITDYQDNVWLGGYPGLLKDMLGIWVEETDTLYENESNLIQICADGFSQKEYTCGVFCDLLRVEGATVFGKYGKDFYQGQPCITENRYGEGKAIYIATKPDEAFLGALFSKYVQETGVIKVLKTSAGVQASLRKNEIEQYLFLINYSAEQQKVELGGKFRNILSNEEESIAMLIPGDYAIYRL